MKRLGARAAVMQAERELALAQHLHGEQTRWLRSVLQRRRVAIGVGGGLMSGVLVGLLPMRRWLRSGVSLFGTAVALARTPLGPLALGALFGKAAAEQAHDTPVVD